jgi:type IV pilus assembly protein PilQ
MIATYALEWFDAKKQVCTLLLSMWLVVMTTGLTRANDTGAVPVLPAVARVGVASQPVAAPAAPSPTQPAEAAPAVMTEVKPADATSEPIVIDYNEADVQSVLRTLAARTGVNLILGDEVTGKVTAHLENVSYEDAIRLIAESKGYAYIKDKNVIRVKSRESVEAEPVEVRVRTLNYAKAEDVKKTIDPVLTKQGKIQVDVRSNTLIISDTPLNLAKLMPLFDVLDTQTPQVMIEAKFVETTKNPKKNLGIDWSNTLLTHQVALGGPNSSGQAYPPGDFTITKGLRPASPWLTSTAVLDPGQAQIVFSYLSADTDTELLANPRVVTTDNGKARIAIATEYPVPQFQFSQQTGGFQISGFDYKDIGIILNVLPRINKNEFVTLEVTPEASSSSANATLTSGTGNSVQIPIIDTRTATTIVLIKSGNTLAIGGLMRQDISDNYTKVPVFGDLPGVGVMFRNKSLSKTKRDLLIFLTPTIIGPEAQTGYEQYSNGFPSKEVYTNDKWMPKDNAKPRSVLKSLGFGGDQDQSSQPPTQNFGP